MKYLTVLLFLIAGISINAQPAVGFETPFTQQAKTNVDAAGWRSTLGVSAATSSNVFYLKTNGVGTNATFNGTTTINGTAVVLDGIGSTVRILDQRLRFESVGGATGTNELVNIPDAGGIQVANGNGDDAPINVSDVKASGLINGNYSGTIITATAGTNLTIVDAVKTNNATTYKQMTNYVAAHGGGGSFVGLTNYMLQAQTNFISTSAFSDANFYSLFTNANSATASGTIEITITNGTTHYPSLVADYTIFVDKAPIIVQRSFAYNDITIGLRASNDGVSQSKLDVFFDSSPFGYLVKFYGQNCFGGGAITQTNNSASLGTAYVFTPSETSQIYSGTLTATLFVGSLTGDISGNANSAGRLNDANGDPALTANSDPNIITIEASHFLSGSGSGLTGIPSTGITVTNTFSTAAVSLNTLYTNGSRTATWNIDLVLTDAVTGTPAATFTIVQNGSLTNIFVRSPVAGSVAGITTNGWSFPLNSGAVYKVQDTSSGTGASVTVKQSVVTSN